MAVALAPASTRAAGDRSPPDKRRDRRARNPRQPTHAQQGTAMVAPVLPALTIAEPDRRAQPPLHEPTSNPSWSARSGGSSFIAMTSEAGSTPAAGVTEGAIGRTTSTTGYLAPQQRVALPRRSRTGRGRHPWRQQQLAAKRPSAAPHRLGGRRHDGQLTSTAWRPLYHPQCGHTTCGSFAGCTEGTGCARAPPASRLLPAGSGSSTSRSSSWDCHRHFLHSGMVRLHRARQARPSRVGFLRAGAASWLRFTPHSGQSPSNRPTERRERQFEDTGIVGKGLKVEPVVGHRVLDSGRVVRVTPREPGPRGVRSPSRDTSALASH